MFTCEYLLSYTIRKLEDELDDGYIRKDKIVKQIHEKSNEERRRREKKEREIEKQG